MINDDWRECQGITEDDEEALALETGEFLNPRSSNNSRPTPKSTPKSTSTLVGSAPAKAAPVSAKTSKRSSSDTNSEESEVKVEDVKPKKKAKKA